MGAIRRQGAGPNRVEYLYQTHTVGRAASCQLVLDRPAVSGHHATIRWSEGAWTLRDLGSRNGTFFNGRRIAGAPEQAQRLTKGDVIIFAESDEVWELVDTSEPKPLLIPLESESAPIELDGRDVFALPCAEQPLMTIYRRHGCWQLERDGDCSLLQDRQELLLGERGYRLLIAGDLPATSDAESHPIERRVHEMRLEIKVSCDEESAALIAQVGDELHEVPPRTFLYLLAYLARRRIDDEAANRRLDAGWVAVETICDELGLTSAEALGLLVHRCRKVIKDCGVDDPAEIIDRSHRGRVRIGVGAELLTVTLLD